MCDKRFCKKCLITTTEAIPQDLLAERPRPNKDRGGGGGDIADDGSNKSKLLCKDFCFEMASKYWINEKKDLHMHELDDRIRLFLDADLSPEQTGCTGSKLRFYNKPEAVVDSGKRMLERGSVIVENIAVLTGYAAVFTTVKSFYYGREIYQNLIATGVWSVFKPVVDKIQSYGIEPTRYVYT